MITDMSAGPFVAELKCSGIFFGGGVQLICMAKRDFAFHLITLHNMQISIIQTEAADFVKINICVILKTFGYDCTYSYLLCNGQPVDYLYMDLMRTILKG